METVYCPRCDRPYEADTFEKAMIIVKKHVSEQHPDHDPNWAED